MSDSHSVSSSVITPEHVWGHRRRSEGLPCTHSGFSDFVCWYQWLCARPQLNYAESRLTQLEGCHCERTCSANGLVYRDKELWVEPENCRNCACKVSVISITMKNDDDIKGSKWDIYIHMDKTPPLVLQCLCRTPELADSNMNMKLLLHSHILSLVWHWTGHYCWMPNKSYTLWLLTSLYKERKFLDSVVFALHWNPVIFFSIFIVFPLLSFKKKCSNLKPLRLSWWDLEDWLFKQNSIVFVKVVCTRRKVIKK